MTVVYRGPSRLDPTVIIVGIVTYDSANTKTGAMAQLWIMRDDMTPHLAQSRALDGAVCGECPYRPSKARVTGTPVCYVRTFQGPRATWEAHREVVVDLQGAIEKLQTSNASIRFGAYGDPAALPPELIDALVLAVGGRATGYTHDWPHARSKHLKASCMASCDAPEDYARAVAEGWRTFRVLSKRTLPILAKREILCPSDVVECISCMLCTGSRNTSDHRKNIAIHAH